MILIKWYLGDCHLLLQSEMLDFIVAQKKKLLEHVKIKLSEQRQFKLVPYSSVLPDSYAWST